MESITLRFFKTSITASFFIAFAPFLVFSQAQIANSAGASESVKEEKLNLENVNDKIKFLNEIAKILANVDNNIEKEIDINNVRYYLINVEYTANMENDLDKIAENEEDNIKILKIFISIYPFPNFFHYITLNHFVLLIPFSQSSTI